MMAYKSKGMKAPRPGAYKQADKAQSNAPKTKPSMQHKEPSHPLPEGAQSKAPANKGNSLPSQDAPAGVAGVNGGSSHALPKGGAKGETEV